MVTGKPTFPFMSISDGMVCVASEMSSSSAVTFCLSEQSLPLESLSSTWTYAGWLAVADGIPCPLIWHV